MGEGCLPGPASALAWPEHYLKLPWQLSERAAQKLWAAEQQVRGFTVIGELVGLMYLLGQPDFREALQNGLAATQKVLHRRRLLGGQFGFWAG